MVDVALTSPGWMCPVSPTKNDVYRIEGTISTLTENMKRYEEAEFHNAAARAGEMATEWQTRLAQVKAQILKRKAESCMTP